MPVLYFLEIWSDLEHFHTHDQHLCKLIGTKESVNKKKPPQDSFWTPTWPPFQSFGTPWLLWHHMKTPYMTLQKDQVYRLDKFTDLISASHLQCT